MRFINSVIDEFQKGKDYADESFVISPNLFGITKPFISIVSHQTFQPYCEVNEIKSEHFLKKFDKSSNDGFRVVMTWEARI